VVPFRIGTRRAVSVTGPDAVQEVLEDRDGVFSKRTRGYDELSLFLGRGLLTSEGERWQHSRRVVATCMHSSRLAALLPLVRASAARERMAIQTAADAAVAIDVVPLATRVTLAVIGAMLVGVDLATDTGWIRESVAVLQDSANARIAAAYSLPMWLPLAAHRRAAKARQTIRAYARLLSKKPAPGSLLEGWLHYAARSGATISQEQIEDEIVTFLLAGHESTASTVAWMLYELAEAPAWDAACASGEPDSLDAAFRETVRLYPQGWSFGRTVTRPVDLHGIDVLPGDLVMVVPYATHRHPAHWPDPERFDPGRFFRVDAATRHRYSFVPFSGGRRVCAGAALAALEVRETVRLWLHEYRFERARVTAPEPRITLRPGGGVWLTPRRRATS
jgi:cytochrome P450